PPWAPSNPACTLPPWTHCVTQTAPSTEAGPAPVQRTSARWTGAPEHRRHPADPCPGRTEPPPQTPPTGTRTAPAIQAQASVSCPGAVGHHQGQVPAVGIAVGG